MQNQNRYSSSMPNNFRGFGCSFEINQNELKMTRFVNGGEFSIWSSIAVGIIIALLFIAIIFFDISDFFIILLVLMITCSQILTYSIFRVNTSGIFIKTIFKEYFIPKEKIDSLVCRTVKRKKGRYGTQTLYDVFIIMKDKNVFHKIDIDTGLCYKDKIDVDYLIDKFNEHLGLL